MIVQKSLNETNILEPGMATFPQAFNYMICISVNWELLVDFRLTKALSSLTQMYQRIGLTCSSLNYMLKAGAPSARLEEKVKEVD